MTVNPFFLNGANAKIKVDSLTLAFVTELSYRVDVKHVKPRVLGMYEPLEVQPVTYDVSGSFTVIRYAKGLKALVNAPPAVSNSGNSIGEWKQQSQETLSSALGLPGGNGSPSAKIHESLDPGKLLHALQFDLELNQQVSGPDGPEECAFSRLRKCRITGSDFSISKRSLATQTFSFEGIYLDEDGYIASVSGRGQHLE